MKSANEKSKDELIKELEHRQRERGERSNIHLSRLAMEASHEGLWDWDIASDEIYLGLYQITSPFVS